jgi:hypothetical protein
MLGQIVLDILPRRIGVGDARPIEPDLVIEVDVRAPQTGSAATNARSLAIMLGFQTKECTVIGRR